MPKHIGRQLGSEPVDEFNFILFVTAEGSDVSIKGDRLLPLLFKHEVGGDQIIKRDRKPAIVSITRSRFSGCGTAGAIDIDSIKP